MAWRRFFDDGHSELGGGVPPAELTLATILLADDCAADEVAFYAAAEHEMLVEWARHGRFILAMCNAAGTELELLCPSDAPTTEAMLRSMPFVAAGLSRFRIRPMMLLRIAPPLSSGRLN